MSAPFRLGFVTGATPDKWARIFEQRAGAIELVPVTEDEQEQGVRGRTLDMVLARLPVDREGLHCIPLYEERPVAVMGVEHVATVVQELRRSRPAPVWSWCRCRSPACTTARTSPSAP